MKSTIDASESLEPIDWQTPSIHQIAEKAGVGTATVDRVLHNRPGVAQKSRLKVLKALNDFKANSTDKIVKILRVGILVDSGISYNQTFQLSAKLALEENEGVKFIESYRNSPDVDPVALAADISTLAKKVDGILLVAPEHADINKVVKRITQEGKPVICITTDLPNSGRTAYVGENQISAGATAALLTGNSIIDKNGHILFVLSLPFRCQQEREQGFRHVLRTKFPNLIVDETVSSHENSARTYKEILKYLETNPPPSAIYNVAGGNIGVAKALKQMRLSHDVLFIGHELNQNSAELLERGEMNYVIGHRVHMEILEGIKLIKKFRQGKFIENKITETLVHTKYNCHIR